MRYSERERVCFISFNPHTQWELFVETHELFPLPTCVCHQIECEAMRAIKSAA